MTKKIETKSEEIDEKRYRNFMILLYEDSTSYKFDDVLFDLKGSFKKYAYIKHQPEEDEKKEHYHFILALDNPRTITSLSKRVGVPANYIQFIKSPRASNRYLVHQDNDNKKKYYLTDVKVSPAYSRQFFASFDDLQTEEDVIDDIYNYIDVISDANKFSECIKMLIKFVNQNAYDTIYKRYRVEFTEYLRSKISNTLK